MNADTLLVIDLSAIAHMMWHVSTNDADPNAASIKTIERVRALASGQPHAVICCDHPSPSFRREIDPLYKANRKAEDRAPLYHQMRLAIDALKADGFPVLEVKGAEADDLIASVCHGVEPDVAVTISTRDKDLLQLVTETGSIVVKWLDSGNIVDADAVFAKLGVRPAQVGDYLCLCGDTSDNVKGAEKVGPKTSASLLGEFGTLEALFAAFDKGATPTMTPNLRTRLQDFRRDVWPTTRQLIALRTDIEIDFAALFAPRVPVGDDVAVFGDDESLTDAGRRGGWAAFDDPKPEELTMQNRPTRAEVAEARASLTPLLDKSKALFGDVMAEAFDSAPRKLEREVAAMTTISAAEARAEIDAVMPERPARNDDRMASGQSVPVAGPVDAGNGATHVHDFKHWMPTLRLWKCVCGATADAATPPVDQRPSHTMKRPSHTMKTTALTADERGAIAAFAVQGVLNATREANASDREKPADRQLVRDDALQGEARSGRDDRAGDGLLRGNGEVRRDGADGGDSGSRARADLAQASQQRPAEDGARGGAVRSDRSERVDSQQALTPVVVEYERQLEPRSLAEAFKLSESMHASRLFSAYGSPHGVLATVLAGREFGMPAMAALRAFHIVEGKPTLAADTIRALILRSGAAEYFRCTERTPERATFATKRKGEPEMTLTYTLAEGRAAFAGDDKAWAKSGWGRNSADMCVARAGAKLARLVYPDVVHGVYAREEMEQ